MPVSRLVLLALLAVACGSETSLSPDVDGEVIPDPPDEEEFIDADATTRGTEHWVAYMENLNLAFNGPPTFAVVVHSESDTLVRVELPQTGYTAEFLATEGWTEFALPNAILYPQGSNVTGVHGLKLTSEEPVEVLALHNRVYFSEATLALPKSELGQRYRVIAAADVDAQNRSSFIVAATEDDTTVTVTPSVLTLAAFGAGNPIERTLNAGETYQVQSLGDLTGSQVLADKPVAVFAGGADTAVECGATSHAWEQLPPFRRWGRDTLAVPLHGQGGDLIVVVADVDGTEVKFGCGEAIVLDAGEYLVRDLFSPARITASAPVQVGQLAKGGDCTSSRLGDANLAIATPEALYRENAGIYAALRDFPSGQGGRTGFALTRGEPGDAVPDSGYVSASDPALEGTLRGIGFAVSQYDARSFSLGYDCVDCVAALSATPDCP